jgi:hypothetical protein
MLLDCLRLSAELMKSASDVQSNNKGKGVGEIPGQLRAAWIFFRACSG